MKTDRGKFEPSHSIYTPQQASSMGIRNIKSSKAGQKRAMRFDFGSDKINNYIAPLIAGQTMVIIAQTTNYKSGFMRYLEFMWAKQLAEEKRNECIIHISFEEVIEEQVFYAFERFSGEKAGALARGNVENWDRLLAASISVSGIPIYRIGDSLEQPEMFSQLYLTNVERSLNVMVSGGLGFEVIPAAICVDYLQAIPLDPEISLGYGDEDRRMHVISNVYRLQDWSKFYNCPVIFNSQAKQKVENEKAGCLKMPGIYDGAEAKEIGDRPNRVLALAMAKQSGVVGSTLQLGLHEFTIAENQLFAKVWKQRGGLPSGKVFPLRINYETGDIKFDEYF